jgi:hypothetical protein
MQKWKLHGKIIQTFKTELHPFRITAEGNSGSCGEVWVVELFIGLASVEVKQI